MTAAPLAEKITRRIRAIGPLTVAAYMASALYDDELGYYTIRQPIGAGADFITSPEISQIFGELIGVWCALMWERIGRPDPVILAELGPGRGALAADLLRAARTLPDFRRALRLHLVEVSPVLRAAQERRLGAAEPVWSASIEDLPPGPLLLVANEFLDALPIRQLVRGGHEWAERMVGLGPENGLRFVAGPESPALSLLVPEVLRHTSPPGTIFEFSSAGLAFAASLGARLLHSPGAELLIDFGRTESTAGSSLRAVATHRPADPFAAPGEADLSADVDFAAIAEAARGAGAAVWGPVPQGRFLEALGAGARLAALTARAAPAEREQLESGLWRLVDSAQMGSLFKVMALTSPGSSTPPGFETESER